MMNIRWPVVRSGEGPAGEPGVIPRYSVAVAMTVLAVTLRQFSDTSLGQAMLYLPLILAVVVSGWFGGLGPGLLAMAGGVAAGLTDRGPTAVVLTPVSRVANVAFFVASSIAVLLISEAQRAARRRVDRALAELVAQRGELEGEITYRREIEAALRAREQELSLKATDLEEVRRQTAETLAILDAFIHHAPVGMIFLDRNHELLRVNRLLTEMMEGPSPLDGLTSPGGTTALSDELQKTYLEVLERGEPAYNRIVRNPGQPAGQGGRSWSIGLFPVRIAGQGEQLIGVGGVVEEITERLRAEDKIRESESRFRALAETVPQLVWVARPDGAVTYFNPRWYDYTGLTPDACLEDRWVIALHPDDRRRAAAVWAEAVGTVQRYEIEYRLRRADGAFRWFLARGTPRRDDDAKVMGWFGTCTDIDDRKRAEEALRDSQERFRLLAETIPDMVWTAGPDGRLTYLNQRWYELTGMTQAQSMGEGAATAVHPEDCPASLETWGRSLREGTPVQLVFRLRRAADSAYRWHLVRGVPLRDPGGRVTQWVGSITDVDDQHRQYQVLERMVTERTAELERSNRELEQFASVASHDLQEPLRKIQSFIERLGKVSAGRLDEKGEEYIRRIHSAADRLRRQIADLLEFSRISTARRPFRRVDLAEVVAEVVSDLGEIRRRTGGRVEVGDLPTIEADRAQMRQLFLNLVGNALKFHRPGVGSTVTITSRRVEPGEGGAGTPAGVEIRVEDDGIGFENDYSDRIFELFERLHGRGEFEGVGMGLAICRRIVERHGGRVRADGRPGAGASFLIQLPEARLASREASPP